MYFNVLKAGERPPATAKNQAFLVMDELDDWNKFNTQYILFVCDAAGHLHHIGALKIGQMQMKDGQRRADIPDTFDALGERFFSLGQDDSYYQNLLARKRGSREHILTSLRDIAADKTVFDSAKNETVTTESLLRSVTGVTVQGQFRRMAKGGERLTPYKFQYTGPKSEKFAKPVDLDFEVDPDSNPPSNIHVLIGPNGVGKTRVLELMARALCDAKVPDGRNGVFEKRGHAAGGSFSGVVSVTFSAFDPFEPLPDLRGESDHIRYSYVGLKSTSRSMGVRGAPKSLNTLTGEFTKSLEGCTVGAKVDRWRDAIKTLESDPIFQAENVSALINGFGDDEEAGTDRREARGRLADRAGELFLKLSTGHKIVLLTITRLVETVEERTLVLFDEPESHLHPPLLSAFIRAISALLINRNGVAILATHSPVVLQEVPKSCTWKLRRQGEIVNADRPQAETFGENLSVLTHEVFGLEVANSGFHGMLLDAVEAGGNFNSILADFSGKLGAEARTLLRVLIAMQAKTGKA